MKGFLQDGRNPVSLLALCFALAPGESPAQNAALAFDHPSGFYESAFRLTLSTPLRAAEIYFTTNGSTPTPAAGLRYDGTIPVTNTTIIRAAAFDGEKALTQIAARTYLFIPAILKQTGAQFPMAWGTNEGWDVPAHYKMSAANTTDASRTLAEALRAIPSLSVITDPENLFSPDTGIYLHPMERGDAWERSVHVEMFDPHGSNVFQINCGLRIHGGMSRRPEESPKHSFRLAFKRRYGLPKLRVPLFRNRGPQEFDELVLRAGNNDSWLDSHGTHRRQASYIRDEWMRSSMREMGHPTARGRFVHLYLNGLYWGLYNLCERPGASLENHDVRKADEIESGDSVAWDRMMALANAGLADEPGYQGVSQYLDLPEFVDYLILNFYAGNSDWDRSANWYAVRPRIPGGKFQFLVWDAERTLADPEINTVDVDAEESPMRLFHKLSENTRFRALFAERARRLLLGKGLLSPDPAATRFRALTHVIAKALPAEAARWGNYRKEVHQYKSGPFEIYTAEDHWQPEMNRILNGFFPQRPKILLDQFRERGLFPQTSNPPGNQSGSQK